MAEDTGGRVEETGFYTFIRSRREVRANAVRRLNTAKSKVRPLKDRKKAELQEMADGLGLEVKGTGSKGRVNKTDLMKALKKAEAEGAGEPTATT